MTICRNQKHNKSFTLIELLVVISVIGLLASIVLVSTQGVRGKAKIAKSLEFSHSIQTALGAYAVGIWDFNSIDSGQVLDGSGYNNHGTVNGATLVSGLEQLGNALSFDGNDYVNAGNNTSLNITDAITIEAWINTAEFGTNQYRGIVGRLTGANTDGCSFQYGLSSQWSGGTTINFWVHTEGTSDCQNNFSSGTVLSLNTWYHVVGTYNSVTGDRKIYINGALDNARNTGAGIKIRSFPNQSLNIGRNPNGNWYFNGFIDEVRIYEVALTLGEIQKHYAEGLEKHKDLANK